MCVGQTALYCATRNGHAKIVLELLNFEGFDSLNTQMNDAHRSTALHGILLFLS